MIVQIYCRNKPAKKTINPYKFLKLKQYLRNSFVVYIGINLRCLSGDIYIYIYDFSSMVIIFNSRLFNFIPLIK
jgi:hypothetical protein